MTQVAVTAAGKRKRRLVVVLTLTSVYLAAEIIGGLLTHSLALLADAGHMFTDTAHFTVPDRSYHDSSRRDGCEENETHL